MNDRKAWIDISKGIAILLVVFEHSLLDSDWLLARVILIFHMPFFFFISGYCFNIKGTSHEVVVAYIRRTILNTLRIVGIIGLVSFPFYTMKSFLKGELTIELIATNFRNYIYGNSIQGYAFGGVLVYCNSDVVQNYICNTKKIRYENQSDDYYCLNDFRTTDEFPQVRSSAIKHGQYFVRTYILYGWRIHKRS